MRTFPSLAVLCLLALGVPAVLPAAADPDHRSHPADSGQRDRSAGARLPQRGDQTSDSVRGPLAREVPWYRQEGGHYGVRRSWEVRPGLKATVWDAHSPHGRIRCYLLAVDYRSRALRIDYADDGAVKRTAPVKTLVGRDRAVAGVNGDFFDIGDTGAPLGIGLDRDRGLLHGRFGGWNSAFTIHAKGRPDIGVTRMTTRVAERPHLRITTLNTPEVTPGRIGIYTPRWGFSSGYSWTGGQRRHVRAVLVRHRHVVSTSTRLPYHTRIRGTLLVGRGSGAVALASLHRGDRATIGSHLSGSPRMAITGNEFLVLDGVIATTDNRYLHPRTAIGIDRDDHEVLLLVVDGRQQFSHGSTMVDLADVMIDLGADEALNLDGGGSSTMVARAPASRGGEMGTVNSPSDGFPRSVANAVEVTYHPSRSARDRHHGHGAHRREALR